METNRLNNWLTLIANFGVIAGIVFLGLEIQQSNRIAIVGTEISVRSGFAEINHAVYSDPGLSMLLVRLADVDSELTIDEDIRVYAFVQQLLNTYMAVEAARDNNMLPPITFDNMESDLRNSMAALPKIRTYFQRAYDSSPTMQRAKVMQTVGKLLEELEETPIPDE
jgi:hypothetical protein